MMFIFWFIIEKAVGNLPFTSSAESKNIEFKALSKRWVLRFLFPIFTFVFVLIIFAAISMEILCIFLFLSKVTASNSRLSL